MQLLLGYLGSVAFATGISTSLLGFSAVFAVILALGVSAALTGFGAGMRLSVKVRRGRMMAQRI